MKLQESSPKEKSPVVFSFSHNRYAKIIKQKDIVESVYLTKECLFVFQRKGRTDDDQASPFC